METITSLMDLVSYLNEEGTSTLDIAVVDNKVGGKSAKVQKRPLKKTEVPGGKDRDEVDVVNTQEELDADTLNNAGKKHEGKKVIPGKDRKEDEVKAHQDKRDSDEFKNPKKDALK